MNKRGVFIAILLLVLLFVTSCGNQPAAGERPLDTAAALRQVQTGTLGVETRPLADYPPQIIYDQNELLAIVEVKNKGNHDLEAFDCAVQITGFDKNIVKGGFNLPKSCAENIGTLEGKNVYNVEGSTNQLEFKSPSVTLPPGVFEYNPTLNFVTCYNYHTTANPEVCVDPLFYQVTSEQKTCRPTDVTMGGGQGAPVGISYVGVDMVGAKAIFEINVRNFGGGRVLSQNIDVTQCAQAAPTYTDLDKVRFDVRLAGNPINCKPLDKILRLHNDQGKIVCSAPLSGSTAYNTPLLIDLDYNYIESHQQPVKIIRTPE